MTLQNLGRGRISWKRIPRLTLLGRAVVLIGGELLFNAICWIAAGITLRESDGLLGLALLAWVRYNAAGVFIVHLKANVKQTIGLRHGKLLRTGIFRLQAEIDSLARVGRRSYLSYR